MKRPPWTNDNAPTEDRWMPSTGPATTPPLPGMDRAMDAADEFIATVMGELGEADRIEAMAVSMFRAAEPRGIWDAADRQTKNYWRARAALRDAGPPA